MQHLTVRSRDFAANFYFQRRHMRLLILLSMTGNIEFKCDQRGSKTGEAFKEASNFETVRKWNFNRHIQKHGRRIRVNRPSPKNSVNYSQDTANAIYISHMFQTEVCSNLIYIYNRAILSPITSL